MITKFTQSIHPFVAGDRLTIADFAIFIYAHSAGWCGLNIDDYPHIKSWKNKLEQRPAVQKGLQIPVPYPFSDKAVTNPDAQDFYNTLRKMGGQWIRETTNKWDGEVLSVPSDYANYIDNES